MDLAGYTTPNDFSLMPYIIEGGSLDIDNCPDCWERRAHIERYVFACKALRRVKVLDFGCGTGYGSEMLFQTGNKVTGYDISETALEYATRLRVKDPNLVFTNELTGEFDACTAFEVIEHVDDPEQFIMTVPAKHLIASVPVIPTVGRNPFHKTDFTVNSFKEMVSKRFNILFWWLQIVPFQNVPYVAVVHGEKK